MGQKISKVAGKWPPDAILTRCFTGQRSGSAQIQLRRKRSNLQERVAKMGSPRPQVYYNNFVQEIKHRSPSRGRTRQQQPAQQRSRSRAHSEPPASTASTFTTTTTTTTNTTLHPPSSVTMSATSTSSRRAASRSPPRIAPRAAPRTVPRRPPAHVFTLSPSSTPPSTTMTTTTTTTPTPPPSTTVTPPSTPSTPSEPSLSSSEKLPSEGEASRSRPSGLSTASEVDDLSHDDHPKTSKRVSFALANQEHPHRRSVIDCALHVEQVCLKYLNKQELKRTASNKELKLVPGMENIRAMAQLAVKAVEKAAWETLAAAKKHAGNPALPEGKEEKEEGKEAGESKTVAVTPPADGTTVEVRESAMIRALREALARKAGNSARTAKARSRARARAREVEREMRARKKAKAEQERALAEAVKARQDALAKEVAEIRSKERRHHKTTSSVGRGRGRGRGRGSSKGASRGSSKGKSRPKPPSSTEQWAAAQKAKEEKEKKEKEEREKEKKEKEEREKEDKGKKKKKEQVIRRAQEKARARAKVAAAELARKRAKLQAEQSARREAVAMARDQAAARAVSELRAKHKAQEEQQTLKRARSKMKNQAVGDNRDKLAIIAHQRTEALVQVLREVKEDMERKAMERKQSEVKAKNLVRAKAKENAVLHAKLKILTHLLNHRSSDK